MFKKILVCLDGSKLAEQILPYAKEQALSFNSKVVLLHVTPESLIMPPGVPGAPGYPIQTKAMVEKMEQEMVESREYLNGVASSLREQGLDAESVILEGSPGEVIVEYAHENKINLIAIATHGRSGLRRSILGSVADYVLRESGLPILVIRPKETEI